MHFFRNILISWQINSIQQKIKNLHGKGKELKHYRAMIAELNRKRSK